MTTVPVERSFSSLNRVETALLSTMAEERLSNLLMVSIEKELSVKLNPDEVIEAFAKMKDRRIKLFLK